MSFGILATGAGTIAANQLFEHFHGTAFSGLIGGAVELYVRSKGWRTLSDAPRPIPIPAAPPPNGIAQAQITAIVPVLGLEFAAAVESGMGPWHEFGLQMANASVSSPERVGVFPLLVNESAIDGTELGRIFSRFQRIAAPGGGTIEEPENELRARDLAQGIAQLAAAFGGRLTIFVSHTKRAMRGGEADVSELIEHVRSIIGQTRLNDFFDASDLQPGRDWDEELRAQASTSALLAIRTDYYASREWCQREMLIAKRSGMPIVVLDALQRGEERGSFLMDHVPRVPMRHTGENWRDSDIRSALNLLVDECLKRALWRRQEELSREQQGLDIGWWAPHAPEPITFAQWLLTHNVAGRCLERGLRVLHPDPPLGPEEKAVLDQIAAVAGLGGPLDIMTPRLLAARGG